MPAAMKLIDKAAKHKVIHANAANRKKYDKYGKDWKHADDIERQRQQQQRQQRQQQSRQQQFSGGGFGRSEYSDFFESVFGGRPSRALPGPA